MNTIKIILLITIFGIASCSTSGEIVFRQATIDDLPGILTLQAARIDDDALRLLFFPEPYHTTFLTRAIEKERMFIAIDTTTEAVVAQLKLFIIDSAEEQKEILANELRCICKEREFLDGGTFFVTQTPMGFFASDKQFFTNTPTLFIYLGSEFTHPAYRRQKINATLEGFAFNTIRALAKQKLKEQVYAQIALCYGLVDENRDRTLATLKRFVEFGNYLGIPSTTPIDFFAYRAHKPEFMLLSNGQLMQLSCGQPGRGCIMVYNLG